MSKYKKGLTLVILYFIISILTLIATIVALNQVFNGPSEIYDGLSVRGMYENLYTDSAPWILTSTAGMAYIGSIVTLCLSVLMALYAGFLTFKLFYLRRNIITATNIIIFIVGFAVLLAFGIACLVTATQITDVSWFLKYPIYIPV